MSKKYWSQQETEVLVNQFILRKEILFSTSASKQAKRRAWKEIHEAILSECPLDKPKDMAELRKKWHNLLANTKKAISLYNSSLKGILILIRDRRNEGVMYDYDLQMVYLLMF